MIVIVCWTHGYHTGMSPAVVLSPAVQMSPAFQLAHNQNKLISPQVSFAFSEFYQSNEVALWLNDNHMFKVLRQLEEEEQR